MSRNLSAMKPTLAVVQCAVLLVCVANIVNTSKVLTKTTSTTTTASPDYTTSQFSSPVTTSANPSFTESENENTTVPQPKLGSCSTPYTSPQYQNFTVELNTTEVNEVQFWAEVGPGRQPHMCKIKCFEGQWVGPLCRLDGDQGRFQPLLKSCPLKVPDTSDLLLSFHDHHRPLQPGSETTVAHGAVLLARCAKLGLQKLLGSASLQCKDGLWSNPLPNCLGTTPVQDVTNITDNYPPAIIINVPAGTSAESAAGELVVRPGSVVHMDCIFPRKLGSPSWSWAGTAPERQYPTGWAMAVEERNWKYRLSLYYLQPRDSGTFTCASPKGHSNAVTVVVKSVQCPEITPPAPPLHVVVEGTYAGQSMHYKCTPGYHLLGSPTLTCLTTGRWSSIEPNCTQINCPTYIDVSDSRLSYSIHNNTYQGVVQYSCPYGYRLLGHSVAFCGENGEWSPEPPACRAIQCPPPWPPLNGRLLENGRHYVGDSVRYNCNKGHILEGQALVVCTENGTWSHPVPYCKLQCSSPGVPTHGSLMPLKLHYDIGDRVHVNCLPEFELTGKTWLTCQGDGSWSGELGTCNPSML